MRREEDLNGNLGVRMYHVVARYPMLADAERVVYETKDGQMKVVVRHPIRDVQSYKAFMYCLWRARYVEELEREVVLYVDKWEVFGLLGKDVLSLEEVARILEPARDVEYEVWVYRDGKGKRIQTFRVFYRLDGYEGSDGKYLKVVVDKAFYEFCIESDLFLYLGFLHELRSLYAINLWTFLTAHNHGKFTEETLFERAGIPGDMETYHKRYLLQRALDYLVKVGYLRGWERQGDTILLHRKSPQDLRILALEKTKKAYEKMARIRENYLQKERERKRRARAKKHTT